MATNYDLLSSCNSSDSSSDDEPNSGKRIDFSFQDLDSQSVEHNLLSFQQANTQGITEKIHLYNNRMASIPGAVTMLMNLRVLDLSNNLVQTLSMDLNRLSNLSQLFLRNNLITEDSFPKSLTGMTRLRDLNLSGNKLKSIPNQILDLSGLRNLFVGGNMIESITPRIKRLNKLRVFYLGGNRLKTLPSEICQLKNLHALILCNNDLQSLPDSICRLQKLECLQLHQNKLTTLPHGLIHLDSLTELSLRDNPLIVRFIRDMSFQPSSLLELAARVVTINRIPYNISDLPLSLNMYLHSSHQCVNPKCRGVYFNTKVEHIRFVDFCGKYRIPLMQYLCSSKCRTDKPAVMVNEENIEEETSKMRRVLLG